MRWLPLLRDGAFRGLRGFLLWARGVHAPYTREAFTHSAVAQQKAPRIPESGHCAQLSNLRKWGNVWIGRKCETPPRCIAIRPRAASRVTAWAQGGKIALQPK